MEGILLLVQIRRLSANACNHRTDHPQEPRHLPESVWDSRIGWATVPGGPKFVSTASMVSLCHSFKIHGTPKTGQKALLVSDSLLMLTRPSLLSASTHSLLETPSDQNTSCWLRSRLQDVFPNLLDHSLHSRLYVHTIIESKCMAAFTRMSSSGSLWIDLQHSCSQSSYTMCRWIAV